MALSSSESALLTQTCENMNVAANTCREVLEMLRSLGNTGVVDIATHNNAQNPHANAKNLFHLDSNGNAVLGTPSITVTEGGWNTYPPFRMAITDYNMANINRWGETKGAEHKFGLATWTAMTDSSGNFIARNDIYSEFGNKLYFVLSESGAYACDASGDRLCMIQYLSGASGDQSHNATTLRINGCNGSGTYSYFVTFEYNAIIPWSTMTIGTSTFPFSSAYFQTAATVTSDRREKTSISALDSKAVDLIKSLRPVQFAVKTREEIVLESDEDGAPTSTENLPGVRHHWGLIAQEVQEALVSAGYDPSDCAVWSLADKNDPDSKQALRYEELIAPMIKVIQNQQERIEALERRVA